MLTERDIEILRFINRFGFCEMGHLNRRFCLNKPFNYQLLRRLVKAGLLKHERIFYKRHGIYSLTDRGATFTNLPPLQRIPIGIYHHEITLIDVYFRLTQQYPEASWVSERELVWDKCHEGVGKKGHVADGMLIFPDSKKIAIELELSLKGRHRSERILKQYGTQFDIHEVWYFCTENVARVLTELAVKKPFIKIKLLKELLSAES